MWRTVQLTILVVAVVAGLVIGTRETRLFIGVIAAAIGVVGIVAALVAWGWLGLALVPIAAIAATSFTLRHIRNRPADDVRGSRDRQNH